MQKEGWLSVCIATMRRWDFLKDTLPVFLARPEVAEVIVCDETGEDASAIAASPLAQNPKLRLVVNERRLGIYENKRKAMRLAAADIPYVAVLDSDNYFDDEWFETLADAMRTAVFKGDTQLLFGSADFRSVNLTSGTVSYPCDQFSGQTIHTVFWNAVFRQPLLTGWYNLFNDGNLVVPRTAVDILPDVSSDSLLAADAIFMLQKWIAAGYAVWYVPGLAYTHTVHPGSSWLETAAASSQILTRTRWTIDAPA